MPLGGSNAVIRLVLSGQQAVVAGLAATRSQVRNLEESTAAYGMTAEKAGKKTWLANQALFTLRRYAYAGTLALTGMGTAAVFMGIKFDASMESNQIAMEQFMGSAGAARKELEGRRPVE
jgi:hypothetical protein